VELGPADHLLQEAADGIGHPVLAGVPEERAKVRGQDRRAAAGHALDDVAAEGLHPVRVVEVDEEVDAPQELLRGHGPEGQDRPVRRLVAQGRQRRLGAAEDADLDVVVVRVGREELPAVARPLRPVAARVASDHGDALSPPRALGPPLVHVEDVHPVVLAERDRRARLDEHLADQRADGRPEDIAEELARAPVDVGHVVIGPFGRVEAVDRRLVGDEHRDVRVDARAGRRRGGQHAGLADDQRPGAHGPVQGDEVGQPGREAACDLAVEAAGPAHVRGRHVHDGGRIARPGLRLDLLGEARGVPARVAQVGEQDDVVVVGRP